MGWKFCNHFEFVYVGVEQRSASQPNVVHNVVPGLSTGFGISSSSVGERISSSVTAKEAALVKPQMNGPVNYSSGDNTMVFNPSNVTSAGSHMKNLAPGSNPNSAVGSNRPGANDRYVIKLVWKTDDLINMEPCEHFVGLT